MKLLVLCLENEISPVDALQDAARQLALDVQIEEAPSVGQLLVALQDERYELTLLPGSARSGLVDSIRRLHPGAPLARYVQNAADVPEGDPLPGLILARLPADLGRLLGIRREGLPDTADLVGPFVEDAGIEAARPALVPPPETSRTAGDIELDEDLVREVVEGMALPPAMRQILLIRDNRLQIHLHPGEPNSSSNGAAAVQRRATTAPLDIEAAELLAGQIASQFVGEDLSGQMRFFQEPGTEKFVVVYSRPAVSGYLLALVAAPETGTAMLRGTANALAHRLGQALRRRPADQPDATVLVDMPLPAGQSANNPYALAWQPRKPLPAALHEPLRLAVERLAGANACHIRHLSLRPEYVQLVVACPAGRNSAWVAHTFKRGMELEIQRQFNIPARLWSDGYFARESLEPLSAAELKLFLNAPA